jgi:hypothetical protein
MFWLRNGGGQDIAVKRVIRAVAHGVSDGEKFSMELGARKRRRHHQA